MLQKTNNPIKKWAEGKSSFPKKTYRQLTDTWKDAHHHLSSGKCKSKLQWDITPHLSEWPKSTIQETTSIGEDMEKKEPSCTVGGNQTLAATVENSMEIPQKVKNRTNPTI